jgi:hypothetical protein
MFFVLIILFGYITTLVLLAIARGFHHGIGAQ